MAQQISNLKINNKDNEPSKEFMLYNIIFKTKFHHTEIIITCPSFNYINFGYIKSLIILCKK